MSTYTITSKNQVTVDPKVMLFLGLKSGDKISYVIEPDGVVKLINPKQLIRLNRGSVELPEKYKTKDLSQTIEEAKKDYFTKSYNKKEKS